MAKVIVADENEGRRNLLASSLEREGFDITRASTLRQAEGTALATMPEVVLLEGDWSTGDVIDASQRLMSDPEFAFKCRIVILSRNVTDDFLLTAAKAGISEVMSKPINMPALVEQIGKHTRKQFVPPPADVDSGIGGGGSFDVGMMMGDGKWALPMLKGLVNPEKINADFINEIMQQLGEEGIEVDEEIDLSMMSSMLRIALNRLVTEASEISALTESKDGTGSDVGESQKGQSSIPSFKQMSKGKNTLGGGAKSSNNLKLSSSMEDILQNQADNIEEEIIQIMDSILDEEPDFITIHEDEFKVKIDPQVLKMTKLTIEIVHDLMWSLGRPGAVSDLTLMTQIEDAAKLTREVLDSLPELEEEE
ncbi:MAG: response regulator [archaeon]|jgi:CheY-like chemotaxis protein|nr:response regulator [archaeon]MDA1129883.1 response regulator [archaeon]